MFTVHTSTEVGQRMEAVARTLAVAIAIIIVAAEATYHAGRAFGQWIHWLNDSLAEAVHNPAEAATAAVAWADRILAQPAPAQPAGIPIPAEWGAVLLSPEQLDMEIAAFDNAEIAAREAAQPKKRSVRRKPATARKAKAAA